MKWERGRAPFEDFVVEDEELIAQVFDEPRMGLIIAAPEMRDALTLARTYVYEMWLEYKDEGIQEDLAAIDAALWSARQ
jgi:hypothetical protein